MRQHGHLKEDIIKRFQEQPINNSYLRDWVYGGIDGAVTTFAVVSGVIGANLAQLVIIILGIANLVADGFSMAAANYVGTKTEQEEYHFYEALEHQHIKDFPEGEEEEIRQIFINKGFAGAALEKIVKKIISDRRLWVKTMLHEEYGLPATIRSPFKAALLTFIAFMICGAVPLLPFIFHIQYAIVFAAVFTGIVFFVIGSIKSKWSIRSWWYCGLTTFLIGVIAASMAFIVGYLFRLS